MSVFFFKQKTAYEMRISDWSSDVCSSDLPRRVYRVDCREVIDELLGKDLPQFRPEVSADPRDLRRRPRRRLGRACSKAVDQRRMRQVGALRVDPIAGRHRHDIARAPKNFEFAQPAERKRPRLKSSN